MKDIDNQALVFIGLAAAILAIAFIVATFAPKQTSQSLSLPKSYFRQWDG
jgi:hypothetical protein